MTRRRRASLLVGLALASVAAACANDGPAAGPRPTTSAPSPVQAVPSCVHPDDRCSTTGSDVTLTVTGRPTGPVRVEPPAGDVLSTIDRDAGIAARLRDGSVLWLFGDTAARDEAGRIVYFVIGTASWASADAPTVTHDAHDPATGAPVEFATPTASFGSCPLPTQRPGMWPAAAVVQAVGPRDRVVIWFHDVCLGQGDGSLADMGMAVGEWWYDPASPPGDAPLRATILNQRLFPHRSLGSAAVVSPDGSLHVFHCASPADPSDRDRYGPCSVGTATVDHAADPAAYRLGGDVAMPRGPLTGTYPAGPFSVAFDPIVGAYVMVYSPWPGPTRYADVRVASRPEGPWSTPVTVTLDGCADRIGTRQFNCYAANAQPSFSTPGHLGIGYYDSSISKFPTRGAYTVVSVPIRVHVGS